MVSIIEEDPFVASDAFPSVDGALPTWFGGPGGYETERARLGSFRVFDVGQYSRLAMLRIVLNHAPQLLADWKSHQPTREELIDFQDPATPVVIAPFLCGFTLVADWKLFLDHFAGRTRSLVAPLDASWLLEQRLRTWPGICGLRFDRVREVTLDLSHERPPRPPIERHVYRLGFDDGVRRSFGPLGSARRTSDHHLFRFIARRAGVDIGEVHEHIEDCVDGL